jgi:hypothetical protein
MAKRKGQKDKQHNGQKKMTEGEPTQWPKENDRRTSSFGPLFWALCFLFFCPFSFGHCVACPSVLFFGQYVTCPSVLYFWSLCMTKKKGQKDKKHNGQKKRTEGQATQ